jgi:hypothetical protein
MPIHDCVQLAGISNRESDIKCCGSNVVDWSVRRWIATIALPFERSQLTLYADRPASAGRIDVIVGCNPNVTRSGDGVSD